jgi:beta-aspartyl-dipeptidase (metallo-type)
MGLPDSILREISEAVRDEQIPLETVLQVATSNPATILKLKGKGFIREGFDADILVLDPDFRVIHLMAMGKMLKRG